MKRVGLTLMACGSTRHPAFMTQKGAGLCPAEFPALAGLIRHPDAGLILFDTGYDAAFLDATQAFPERLYRWATPMQLPPGDSAVERLARLSHAPGDITAIVLSHFHGDHVAGLRNFPAARIFCARAGLERLHAGGRFARVRQGLLSALAPPAIAARASFFEDGAVVALPQDYAPFSQGIDLLGDGSLIAMALPGHCPGHWGLGLRLDDDRPVLLTGDAAWSIDAIQTATPPPRITTALLGETQRYRETLMALHRMAQTRPDTVLLPSHCRRAARRSGLLDDHDD